MAWKQRKWKREESRKNAWFHPPPAPLPEPDRLQKLLQTVELSTARPSKVDGENLVIKDVELVASYNWKESHAATILVPGKPPLWKFLKQPQRLEEDKGEYFRDPNSARYASYPTEPAMRAILDMNPEFDMSEIDIFGCGNTFGSLLSFAKDEDRTFRFGVELIGQSLFLIRKTNTPKELIDNVYGHGHTFPEAYTIWEKDVQMSASHQRIIKYNFAGLKCFVRSESDGYLPALIEDDDDNRNAESKSNKTSSDVEFGDLSSLLVTQNPSSNDNDSLNLEHAGRTVPQKAVFDLKTRSIWDHETQSYRHGNPYDQVSEEFQRRVWVNQTSNMILAFHDRGKFEPQNIHVLDVTAKSKEWEHDNVDLLYQYGDLLNKLVTLAKDVPNNRFEVRRSREGPLQIWSEVPGWSALPAQIKAMWKSNSGEACHENASKPDHEEK